MNIFKRKINPNDIIGIIDRKHYGRRFAMMLFGMTLVAISFNVFYTPFHLITGGVSGLSLVFNKITNIAPSSFMYIVNAGLLYVALFFLGPKFTMKSFFVSMLFPFLVDATSFLQNYFVFPHDQKVLVCIYAGLLTGIGAGLVYKAGFNTGGLDTLKYILMKKSKIPIAKAMFIIDGIVIIIGTIIFKDLMIFMYSIIVIYVVGFTVDRILLGVSNSKAFYLISNKADEIADFALDNLSIKATIVKVKGSLHHADHEMLMFIVPTKDYYYFKEAILAIDEHAFFTIIDVYQTYGLNEKMLSQKKIEV